MPESFKHKNSRQPMKVAKKRQYTLNKTRYYNNNLQTSPVRRNLLTMLLISCLLNITVL